MRVHEIFWSPESHKPIPQDMCFSKNAKFWKVRKVTNQSHRICVFSKMKNSEKSEKSQTNPTDYVFFHKCKILKSQKSHKPIPQDMCFSKNVKFRKVRKVTNQSHRICVFRKMQNSEQSEKSQTNPTGYVFFQKCKNKFTLMHVQQCELFVALKRSSQLASLDSHKF